MKPTPHTSGPFSAWQIFRWPAILFVLTLAALIGALTGDGGWDQICWMALSIPALLALWFMVRPDRK